MGWHPSEHANRIKPTLIRAPPSHRLRTPSTSAFVTAYEHREGNAVSAEKQMASSRASNRQHDSPVFLACSGPAPELLSGVSGR